MVRYDKNTMACSEIAMADFDVVRSTISTKCCKGLICVYGPPGSGKTTLLQRIEKAFDGKTVLRAGVETLIQDLVTALVGNNESEFLCKYLDKDKLLIDNLWLLEKHQTTATEILCLLEKRIRNGSLTILTSDISQEEWNEKNAMIGNFLASAQSITLNPDV